jgi:hypothetical protein
MIHLVAGQKIEVFKAALDKKTDGDKRISTDCYEM